MSKLLTNRALLATINVSQWTGRKIDRKATDTVETTHKTEKGVGNYTKKLLPSAKQLEEIQRATNNIRLFFYKETLPWHADGSRILSNANYVDFVKKFRDLRSEFYQAVQEFIKEYPTLKENAKVKLGEMYRENEYPSQKDLEHSFKCEISFMPIPDVGDFRVEILEDEKEAFEKRMKETENNAMRDCWDRLHGAVSHAAMRLNQPEGQIRDSLIENIKEICAVLPKLNFADDPKLEQMRKEVENTAFTINPESCRNSVHAKKQAAEQLNSMMARMSVFMGK